MKSKNHVAEVIFKTAAESKFLSAGVLVTVAGSVASSLMPPLILGKLIDSITAGKPLPFNLAAAYVLFIVLTGLLDSSKESLLIAAGQRITHALRSRMCSKLTMFSAGELNRQEPGAVASRFVGDVNTVENLFTSGIISMFADACKILSILIIVFNENRGLSAMLLVLMPLIFWFTRIVQRKMLAAQLENRAAVSRVTNHVPESLRCIRTIHTLGKEKYMEKRYDEYIGRSYEAIEKTNFYDSIYSPVILILNAVIVAAVMVLSASGSRTILTFFGMSVGTAVAVINYISQIFSPLESLGMEIQTIQSAAAGVKRINDFLSVQERTREAGCVFPEENEHCIELKNVCFGYDDHEVLKDISFTADRNEQITLAGRTGAGKSTIFRLLLGLYSPGKGEVLIKGVSADRIPDSDKRRIFGYVEQSFHQVPGSIKDQITLGDADITDEMVREAAELVGLNDTICSFEQGYDAICTPGMFSQGQWQLLSIARAVAGRPDILLLDEITANLDADTELTVLAALSRASKGRTVISISHRIYEHSGGRLIRIDQI